jgi:hypothetical protein
VLRVFDECYLKIGVCDGKTTSHERDNLNKKEEN